MVNFKLADKWPSPRVLVAQWKEHLPSVQEVMGLIPVGDSYFFFVPRLCHVDYFIFITFITKLKRGDP